MARPLFSCIVPTLGRQSLPRTLASIREQAVPAEILVVADAHGQGDDILRAIELEAGRWDARFLSLDAGRHDTGSPQIALGYRHATGAWLLVPGDDDVYLPDAFATILGAVNEQDAPHPLMFRTEMLPNAARGNTRPVTLWDRKAIERFHVTGQGFCCPNDPARLGAWVNDHVFMEQTVWNYDGRIDWREETIARCY